MEKLKIIITHDGAVFVAKCSFESRHAVKEAGFMWNPTQKTWTTRYPDVAARLERFCDKKAKEQLCRNLIDIKPWSRGISHKADTVAYEFQIKAAEFALSRKNSYIAADPGLGKTVIAALIMNSLAPKHSVYICPPFLKKNVEEEFKKWSLVGLPEIVADTQFSKMETARAIDLLIIDEAHRYKSLNAKRTKFLFEKIFPRALHVVFMSGTPMPNRPMELYSILKHAAPEAIEFRNQFEYGIKYCGGYRSNFGWDFSGASNMLELTTNLKKKFMLRIRKEHVLKELPPKLEELVFLSQDMPKAVSAMDKSLVRQHSPTDVMKALVGDPHIATYRKIVGEHKVPLSAEFILDILDTTQESVLVFAHHKSVIQELRECLKSYDPIVITGDTESSKRQMLVDEFQRNPKRRVFIGNIQASGVGFTLTRASRVCFVEASWVPAENEQASDRAHRIGQDQRVLVQYLVYRDSLDASVIQTILEKRKTINHI